MAILSLCEISQSQLPNTPIINGQLICCTDTGNFYRDSDKQRITLSEDVIVVSNLPLAPLSNKIYLLKPDKLYIYDQEWILLNDKPSPIVTKISIYDFPAIGEQNHIYISTTENKTFRWNDEDMKYYCIGSDYNDIKIINGGGAS